MKAAFPCLFLFASLLLSSCGSRNRGEFRGYYLHEFEGTRFLPCGSDEEWWVDIFGHRPLIEFIELELHGNRPYVWDGTDTVFVRWTGARSVLGEWGHMGLSDREFVLDSVLEVRLPEADDCG